MGCCIELNTCVSAVGPRHRGQTLSYQPWEMFCEPQTESPSYGFSLPLLDTTQARTLELVLLWNKPGSNKAEQIHLRWAFKANTAHLQRSILTKRGGNGREPGGTNYRRFLLNVGSSCVSRVGIVNVCVCVCARSVLGFLPQRQAATTSYPRLAYIRTVHRKGTNEERKRTKQQQGKSPNSYKLWYRCSFSFQQ